MPKSIAKRRCFENRYIHTKRERYIYGVEENVFMDKQAVGVQLGEDVVQRRCLWTGAGAETLRHLVSLTMALLGDRKQVLHKPAVVDRI